MVACKYISYLLLLLALAGCNGEAPQDRSVRLCPVVSDTPCPPLHPNDPEKEPPVKVEVESTVGQPFKTYGHRGAGFKIQANGKINIIVQRKAPHQPADAREAISPTIHTAKVTPAELEALRADPSVAAVQENIRVYPSLDQAGIVTHARSARLAGAYGKGAVIAVLDSGIQSSHDWIIGRTLIPGACFSTPDGTWRSQCPGGVSATTASGSGSYCQGPGLFSDVCAHGTHVAGISAGSGPTSIIGPLVSMAPQAQLYSIQIYAADDYGISSDSADILRALHHVYDMRNAYKFAAVNISSSALLYSSNCDKEWAITYQAVQRLKNIGIPVVAATGNLGDKYRISWPACLSNIVAVAASTDGKNDYGVVSADAPKDDVAAFSNTSPQTALFAPGHNILSSMYSPSSHNFTALWTGTSMATPSVASAFAALMSLRADVPLQDRTAFLRYIGKPIFDGVRYRPRLDLARISEFKTLDGVTCAYKSPWFYTNAPGYTATTSVAMKEHAGCKFFVDLPIWVKTLSSGGSNIQLWAKTQTPTGNYITKSVTVPQGYHLYRFEVNPTGAWSASLTCIDNC